MVYYCCKRFFLRDVLKQKIFWHKGGEIQYRNSFEHTFEGLE